MKPIFESKYSTALPRKRTGQTMTFVAALVCALLLVIVAQNCSRPASAQSTLSKFKRGILQQACKGGDQNACQQLAKSNQTQQGQAPQTQQPKQQVNAQPASSSAAAYQPASASASSNAGGQPDSNCCTADAIKNIAAAAGFIDVVGIKLGMTPQQATAAIKAHNPALMVKQITMRLAHPGVNGFDKVPHYIVGYNAEKPAGWEVIVVEFTTPPNSPAVAAAISRFTNFEPTIVANLVNGLDKKYGPEYPRTGNFERTWIFDHNGKPITTPSKATDDCIQMIPGVLPNGLQAGGSFTAIAQENRDGPLAMDVNTFNSFPLASSGFSNKSECAPYTQVWTNLVTGLSPNSQTVNVTTTIGSGALAYAAERSTHDWLQAEADAKIKAERDAASKRTGTTF